MGNGLLIPDLSCRSLAFGPMTGALVLWHLGLGVLGGCEMQVQWEVLGRRARPTRPTAIKSNKPLLAAANC
jgi:hypothetical protein